jgi:hypothetical protein
MLIIRGVRSTILLLGFIIDSIVRWENKCIMWDMIIIMNSMALFEARGFCSFVAMQEALKGWDVLEHSVWEQC